MLRDVATSMIAQALPWIALFLGFALLMQACRGLATDAQGGFEVTMGGAMLFSQLWLVGAAASAWGITALLGVSWWVGFVVFAAFFVLKGIAYRIIVAIFLGRSLPAPTATSVGFSALEKRAELLDEKRNNAEESEDRGK